VRAHRIFWFVVAIAIGVGAGLLFGWMVLPGRMADTSPDTLRADYRTDLVLMTAEIYQQESDPAAAVDRLGEIYNDEPALRVVQQAILTGQELGYARSDIETLARLFQALQTWTPSPESSQP
jgi:hypothetical protein